jgi:hypothetical protein
MQNRDTIACGGVGAALLRINEVVAGQTRLITDRRGDFEDYIESEPSSTRTPC